MPRETIIQRCYKVLKVGVHLLFKIGKTLAAYKTDLSMNVSGIARLHSSDCQAQVAAIE